MMQFVTVWKILKYFSVIAGIFAIILVPLINGIVHGFQTSNWKPALDSSAGLVFASDQTMSKDVTILANLTILSESSSFQMVAPEDADSLNKKFSDYLKSEIIVSFLVMASWFVLFYWLYSWILTKLSGQPEMNFGSMFFVAFMSIFTIALMEFLYSWIAPPHNLVYPLSGIWKLITHPSIWATTSLDEVMGVV